MDEDNDSPPLRQIKRQHHPSIAFTRTHFRKWVDQQAVYEPDRDDGYNDDPPS